MELPKRYDPGEAEPRWQKHWIEQGTYKFDPKDEDVYVIDTPPPTVSGLMHIGHAFSYSQQDIVARYKRMKGFNMFFPFGTDDNGLATERLVEKMKKVRARDMPRDEFIKLCLDTLDKELRPNYVANWKKIGMSCDWDIFYTTINDHCRKISQSMFLDLIKKDRAYRKEAPVIWCPQCATALSQVEIEDKEFDSHFNDIVFKVKEKDVVIATTRPELLPACVAMFFHPDDKRYQALEGKKAKVPLFEHEVKVLSDKRVDMEKGTGIVMCCTFGDQTDMEWQKAYNLEIKEAFTPDGKMTGIAGKYKGMPIKEARKAIIDDLKNAKLLIKQEPIKHHVNVHERCQTEVEFLHSPQWFIRYLDIKDELMERGRQLNWHPKHMLNRYENWVNGLQWDWCISRQRFSGVPFPVWYEKKTGEPIFADEKQLPVDPLKDLPKGYSKDQVVAEQDVMDTWATSSLTPRLAADLFKDHKIYKKLLPMDLRPQAHDIITFWLFNTVVRSHLHDNELPFKDVMISGWALDPKGKKMSKSKGNVVEPQAVVEKYGADALRYWTAGSKLGEDTPYQEKDVVTGHKTVNKLWNASKFTIMNLEGFDGKKPKLEVMDQWILCEFNRVVKACTEGFEEYEYSRAKLEVDNFFWNVFCDYYLEIVKDRLYNPDQRGEAGKKSAQYALHHVLLRILKLFAPIMPHITEEIYQLYYAEKGESIHRSKWPEYDKALLDWDARIIGAEALKVIAHVRKYKTDKNVSLNAELDEVIITSDNDLTPVLDDIAGTTRAKKVTFKKAKRPDVGKVFEVEVK
ncbi:valine--tRNA ligase [Nanoarchaeota archaeon]